MQSTGGPFDPAKLVGVFGTLPPFEIAFANIVDFGLLDIFLQKKFELTSYNSALVVTLILG